MRRVYQDLGQIAGDKSLGKNIPSLLKQGANARILGDLLVDAGG
jgi:hypothetical protein